MRALVYFRPRRTDAWRLPCLDQSPRSSARVCGARRAGGGACDRGGWRALSFQSARLLRRRVGRAHAESATALHRRVAQWVAETGGHVLRRAHHLLQSGGEHDVEGIDLILSTDLGQPRAYHRCSSTATSKASRWTSQPSPAVTVDRRRTKRADLKPAPTDEQQRSLVMGLARCFSVEAGFKPALCRRAERASKRAHRSVTAELHVVLELAERAVGALLLGQDLGLDQLA